MAYQKKFNGYYTVIENDGGETLGVMDAPVIEKDGFAFKDLAGTGELLPYEDWRLSPEERAKDLAARLSPEAVAGLTLFSSHQSVPAGGLAAPTAASLSMRRGYRPMNCPTLRKNLSPRTGSARYC